MRYPLSAGGTDRRLLAAMRSLGDEPRIAAAARALSWSGEHGALWLAAGLAGAAADRGHRGRWLRATALVTGAHLAGSGMKRVVRRPRPEPRGPGRAGACGAYGAYGFPSSHAASSVAAALAFRSLLPGGRNASAVGATAAAMCLSRLVLGVHYPSDVVAGAALGAAAALLGRSWLRSGTGGAGRA